MYLNDSPKRPAGDGTAAAVLAAIVTAVVVAAAAGFVVAGRPDDVVRDGGLVPIPSRSLIRWDRTPPVQNERPINGELSSRGVDVHRSRPQAFYKVLCRS